MKKILSMALILCIIFSAGITASAAQYLMIGQSGEWTLLTEVVNNSYGYFETPFMKIKGATVSTWNESMYIPGFGDIPLYVVEAKGSCTLRHCGNEISIKSDAGDYLGTLSEVYLDEDEITLSLGTYMLDVNIGGDGYSVKLHVTAPDIVYVPEPQAPALPEASVTLNGSPLILDQSAVIIDGRVMVPVRAIFEAMGLTLDWNDTTKTATATKEGVVIVMSIDNKVTYVNGEAHVLDVPPQIIGGRTMVPVRFVSESMGAEVTWDDVNKNVIISYKGE